MSDDIGNLLKSKDFQGFSQLLSAIEKVGPSVLSHKELLSPTKKAFRVGVTGPPGAGKSTLVGGLISELRKKDLTVGVIAVDPSSPFTKGAILGDRIRYSEHFEDDKVFIRSLGSRGSLGGLSASAYLMLRAFDHYGFDVVLIETVGVGQTELEIMNVADFISVVLVPESGDSVQAMKAGLLEIANLFVVNKSDRAGAENIVNELKSSYENVETIKTVATENKGVNELAQFILTDFEKKDFIKNRESVERLRSEAKALLRYQAEEELDSKTESLQTLSDFQSLFT